MKTIVIALLACIFACFKAQETVQGAGVALHVRQEFFDNIKDSVLREFVESIEIGKVNDIHFKKDIGAFNQTLFSIALNMTNIELHNFKMDLDTSFLKLNEQNPHLELFISNLSTVATFDFNFFSEPSFISDVGKGYFNLEPTSLYLGYTVDSSSGRPIFIADKAIMNSTDLTFVLNGTADFSKLIFQVSSYLKIFIKDKVNDYFTAIIGATVSPIINNSISSYYRLTYNLTEDIIVNFTSTVPPQFTEDDMTVFFKGEARPIDSEIPFSSQLQVPSEVNTKGRQLQVGISDYLLNTTIYSLYKKDYLQVDTKNINGTSYETEASYLFYVFPKLAEKLQPTDLVSFRAVAKSTNYYPYMEIVGGVTTAYIEFDIEMINKNETLLKMDYNVEAKADVNIVQGFKLTVDIQTLKFNLIEITENNIDPTIDERDINAFIGFISGFARNYVNQFVRNFDVPLPFGDNISLKDVSLIEKDFFIYADVTPIINILKPSPESGKFSELTQ